MKLIRFFIFLFLPFGIMAQSKFLSPKKEPTPSFALLLKLLEIDSTLPPKELMALIEQNWLQPNKERWEFQPRYEDKKEEAFILLDRLGYIQTKKAKDTHTPYENALVLGSLGKTMQKRLDFLYSEWERGVRFNHLYLLSGQRDLNPKLETVFEGLHSETELLVYLYEHHPLKEVTKNIPVTVIDSPKEQLPFVGTRRPNTASTVRDFLAKNPKNGSCLIVSNQPYIDYQEAVCRSLLPNSFEIETIGPAVENNSPISLAVYLDNLAKCLLYEYEQR